MRNHGRHRPGHRLQWVVIAAACLSAPLAATAQFAAPTDIEEVVVTAQRREQPQFDVPISVSVVLGGTLEALGIDTALGLSYRVPGLVVQEGAPGNQLYTIRGIGNAVGLASLVGVYLDEVDITRADSFGQYDVSLYDLERVEVLRGPQGTLYGAGSAGGTVRLITRKPLLDAVAMKAEASAFGQARGDPGYEIKAALNLPLVEDTAGVRLVLNHHDWGGWIDQPAAGRDDVNDNDMTDLRLRALWQATPRLTVNGTAIAHRNEGGGTNVANLQPYSESLVQTFVDPTEGTPFVDDYDHLNLTADYAFDTVTLLSASGWFSADRHGSSARRFEFEDEFIPGLPGSEVYESITHYDVDSDLFTQELRLTSGTDGPLAWTAGALFRREEARDSWLSTQAFGGEIFASDVPTRLYSKNESWSLYGDASYALDERWELGAGLRYFEETRDFADLTFGTRQRATFDDSSPRVYVAFAPVAHVNLYAGVSQGFRSGGFNSPYAEELGAPATYGPENVTSYELGSKLQWADGRLYAEFALFRSDYSDMQGYGLIPGALVEVVSNVGEAEIEGFEWTLDWRPWERLRLGFNGSVIDATIVAVNALNTAYLPGDPVDQVADYGWSLFADYAFAWRGGKQGYVRAGYDRQGPIHFTDRSFGLTRPFGVSDTLGFLYASIGVQLGPAVVELFGRNLLDEHGRSSPLDIGALETQPRPRVIGVRLAYALR